MDNKLTEEDWTYIFDSLNDDLEGSLEDSEIKVGYLTGIFTDESYRKYHLDHAEYLKKLKEKLIELKRSLQ